MMKNTRYLYNQIKPYYIYNSSAIWNGPLQISSHQSLAMTVTASDMPSSDIIGYSIQGWYALADSDVFAITKITLNKKTSAQIKLDVGVANIADSTYTLYSVLISLAILYRN